MFSFLLTDVIKEKMETYCLKCKKNTENLDPKILKQKIIDCLCSQNVVIVELKSQDLYNNKKLKVC